MAGLAVNSCGRECCRCTNFESEPKTVESMNFSPRRTGKARDETFRDNAVGSTTEIQLALYVGGNRASHACDGSRFGELTDWNLGIYKNPNATVARNVGVR